MTRGVDRGALGLLVLPDLEVVHLSSAVDFPDTSVVSEQQGHDLCSPLPDVVSLSRARDQE